MKKFVLISIIIVVVVGLFLAITVQDPEDKSEVKSSQKEVGVNYKQYSSSPEILTEAERMGKKAYFETSLGNFTISLFGDKAPKTASNFIFLAKDGFYNGLTFHRVIAGFMIQGGDPAGNGTGGPGYQFEDEFNASLTFSKPGILAMANSGPATNGSQFFITVAPTTYLNNKHTIFGEVTEGYSVIEKISQVAADSQSKPLEAVVIKKVEIK